MFYLSVILEGKSLDLRKNIAVIPQSFIPIFTIWKINYLEAKLLSYIKIFSSIIGIFLTVRTCALVQMQMRPKSTAQNCRITWCVARTAWVSSHRQTPRQWRRQWAAWWWTSSGGRRWPCLGWPRRMPSLHADLQGVASKNCPNTLELRWSVG